MVVVLVLVPLLHTVLVLPLLPVLHPQATLQGVQGQGGSLGEGQQDQDGTHGQDIEDLFASHDAMWPILHQWPFLLPKRRVYLLVVCFIIDILKLQRNRQNHIKKWATNNLLKRPSKRG